MSKLLMFTMLFTACAGQVGEVTVPPPQPQKCYLLDDKGGYLTDQNGERLTCD